MQTAEQTAPLKCLCCMMTDPPPAQTYHQGRDRRVGFAAGCPGCGRLAEACARRPCSAIGLVTLRRGSWAGRAVAAVLSLFPRPGEGGGDR